MNKRFWAALAGCLMINTITTAFAEGAAAGPPRLDFEKYRLANGLDVILVEDKRLPLVAVNLWYHVGPANERAGRTGFAHLFEHMMFQGSRHVGNDQHFALLEGAGATDINGTTDFDRTNYFETLPSNELELALWIESDRMGYLLDTLDQEKLTGQIDVVRNERRQSVENAPYGLAEEELFHQLYPKGHPYFASVIGSHADIEAAKLDDVRAFFSEYYAPNNASLAIVGDIDKAHARELIEKYFGPLKASAATPARVDAMAPALTSERRATVTDKVELPRVYMGWISPPIYQPGDAEADLLGNILGGGKSSRLYKKLVYEMKIAQDVSAYQQSLTLGSLFQISATAKPDVKPEQLEKAIDEEIDRLKAEGPSAAELERARNTAQTGMIRGLETLGGFGGVADTLNRYNHYLGTPDYLQSDFARYTNATTGSVQTLAQSLLKHGSRAVIYAVPGDKQINDVARTQPEVKKGDGQLPPDPASEWRAQKPGPAPASALSLPVPQQFKLDNGLTVLLVEQHQLPVMAANLVVLRGSEANSPTRPGLASFTAGMLDEGTQHRSALQMADDSAQIGASLGTSSSMDSSGIGIGALRSNADRALELLADAALHPAFAADELARVRNDRLTDLLQQADSPRALAGRVFAHVVYGERHPYGYTELGTAASLKAISRNDLLQFWKAGYTPGNSALVLSGDLTPAEARALAEKHFGAWKGSSQPVKLPATPAATARHVVIVDKPGAPQTYLAIGNVGVARSNPDYVPIEVMATTLGGLFASRINMNLREEHGYTYGAGAGFGYRRGPGPFRVSTSVRTDVTAPAVGEIFKELARMRDTQVSADELRLARDSFSRSLPGLFETTSQSVGSAGSLFVYGLPLDYYSKLPADIARVGIEDVQRVAQKYLQPEHMTVVAVGDRAKIEAPLAALKLGSLEQRDVDGKLVTVKAAGKTGAVRKADPDGKRAKPATPAPETTK